MILAAVCYIGYQVFKDTVPQTQTKTQLQVSPIERLYTLPEIDPEKQPKTTPLPPLPRPTNGPTRRLYHGTDVVSANSIVALIDLTTGRDELDFGQGFYTTASLKHAQRLAKTRGGSNGAIVVFDVPISELYSLNYLVFSSADSNWEAFVVYHRSVAGVNHDYDWVEGPVAKDWNVTRGTASALPYPEYHQLSIHTEAARWLFQKSISGVVSVTR
jgi:hypothetical protein